jgi:hypothetical protein
MMMCLSKWTSVTLAIALMAGNAAAADTVSHGKVKSIDAANKTFVLTDVADKDWTFKLGDKLIVNRAGKETTSDLKVGDPISVCYDKGLLTWTANYILIQEGTSKNCCLVIGNVKSYDAGKKEMVFTDEAKKDSTFPIGKAMVRLNMANSTMDNVKIGDHALLIVDNVGEKSATLHSVMIERAK